MISFRSSPIEPIRDPLWAVELVVVALTRFLLVITGLFLLAFALSPLTGEDVSLDFGGLDSSDGSVCAVADVANQGFEVEGGRLARVVNRPDGRATVETTELCVQHPSAGVRAAAIVTGFTGLTLFVAVMVTLERLTKQARRGLFESVTVRRTRRLGWLLLAGLTVKAVVDGIDRGLVTRAGLTTDAHLTARYWPDLPWTLLLVGVGVLGFARMLDHAVVLQAEVDATV